MSPEQAEGPQGHVDARADIYALGALFYELLADAPPFDPEVFQGAAYVEIHRILHEVDPPAPSSRLARQAAAAGGVRKQELRRRVSAV